MPVSRAIQLRHEELVDHDTGVSEQNQGAKEMKDFRGIGLLDCSSKFYVGCLMSVAKKTTRLENWWLKVVSMAYTPKCCTAHETLLISTLL